MLLGGTVAGSRSGSMSSNVSTFQWLDKLVFIYVDVHMVAKTEVNEIMFKTVQ